VRRRHSSRCELRGVRVRGDDQAYLRAYAVNLMMAALVVRERDIEMMRELTR